MEMESPADFYHDREYAESDNNSELGNDFLMEEGEGPMEPLKNIMERVESDEAGSEAFYDDDYADLFSEQNEYELTDENIGQGDTIGFGVNTFKENTKLLQLRRRLDQLEEKLHEKEFEVLRARDELDACRMKIWALEGEQQEVHENMERMKDEGNNAAYFRLVSQHKKLKTEISNEYEVESLIKADLHLAELALSEVALEQRHYMNLSEKVAEQEEKVHKQKRQMADFRLKKESQAAARKERQLRKAEQFFLEQLEQEEKAYNARLEAALVNNIKARQFLQMSLQKIKKHESQRDQENLHLAQKRMKSVVDLKKSIALTQENLQALQARNAAQKRKLDAAEKKERQQILKDGGNPDQVILQRRKLKEQEKLQRSFAVKQSEAFKQIAGKILMEEQKIEKRKKQQPQLWSTPATEKHKELGPLKKKSVMKSIKLTKEGQPYFIEKVPKPSSVDFTQDPKYFGLDFPESEDLQTTTKSDALSSPTSLGGRLQALAATRKGLPQDEDLAQPEFEGLWTKKHKDYKAPKDETSVPKPVGGSDMERAILKKVLDKHRAGITVKQVAAGREFTGQPFYSKPDVIHFKDFDVGKTYKKKIVITNVSYSMNFCKFVEISEHLKDFISVDFKPPGQMSAGMSCDMNVTFTPMINNDLDGEVKFQAQTGPFSIPLKCSTKKCDLCLDVDFIDFGSQVVGETVCRSVNLINKGALGTRFEFFKVPDKAATTYTTETSLGRLTTAETVAMTPVDESDVMKTATTAPQETTTKQQRRQTTKEGLSTAAMTSIRPSETPGLPMTEDQDRIREMKVDIIEEGTDTERDVLRSEGDEIKFASTVTDYSMLPEEIKVGQTMSGEIGPFSSLRLDVIFSPSIPGNVKANFRIAFSDKDSTPLTVKTAAKAIDVPVWIENPTIDLKICMYDRLYQDQLIVKNRATTALRLNFEVPKELRNHVELLPKTGYIQARSTFTAQLKFLPRKTLAEEASGLFDPDSGVLEAPMVIQVADQTRPVPFTVMAVVTCSDLEFDQEEINFGECGIYESVTHTIKLTNYSILPQNFGFVDVPDYAEVQPNDGFGTILPLETIELDVIMNADKARSYGFKLICKNGIGRQFSIRCRAVGVHPPLELTKQVINFAATSLGDTSSTYFHVVNSHVSANEFTHPVPRIGKGEIVPVGPTSFEFCIPEGAPISLAPSVGTVNPGEKCHINVYFNPTLSESEIREEAVHVIKIQKEDAKRRETERKAREQTLATSKVEEDKNQGKGKKSKTPARGKTTDSGPPKSGKSEGGRKSSADEAPTPSPDEIEKDSVAYKAAFASLTRSYMGSFQSFKIPCFVATGACGDVNNPPTKTYRSANILYLDVHCPIVKPQVVVISNHGQNRTEFGQVSIGQNTIQPISIQNICDQPIDLTLSSLDTNGPFQVLNALRTLKPEETHTLLVSFTPNAGKLFYEVLKVISSTAVLSIPLTGEGVSPVINLSITDGVLDLGDVLEGEAASATFTLSNSSSLKVDYSIRLDSSSLLKHALSQHLPNYVLKHKGQKPNEVMLAGPQNYDGSSVFDCVPCEGTIATGESHEITVNFKPDHSSRHFSEAARIVLFNSEQAHVLKLRGRAHRHMMFLDGYDAPDLNTESLTAEEKPRDMESDAPEPTETILLTFRSKITDGSFQPATRQIIVGCLRTNAFVTKKNGEWIVENFQHAQSVGFTIEQLKGVVDCDATKGMEIVWTPTEGQDPNLPIESTITLTLKADVALTYNVLLRALLVLH